MTAALKISESDFLTELIDVVKVIDNSAKVVPSQADTASSRTAIKVVSYAIISAMEKREALYDALLAYALQTHNGVAYRHVMDYTGWKLYVEDKTFETAIHTVSIKLYTKG